MLIGLLAGIINVIPYIGPLIGASIGIIIGISTNLDLDFYTQMIPLIVKICVVFGVMQLIDNFLLQPVIFSNSVKAHPRGIFSCYFCRYYLGDYRHGHCYSVLHLFEGHSQGISVRIQNHSRID